MSIEESRYHEAAARQGLSIHKRGDGSWSVGPAVHAEPLGVGPHEPFETLLADGMVRIPDGRTFKREMTTKELRAFLGIEGEAPPTG